MSYCGSQTIAIAHAGKAKAFPLRCRSWGCKHCAPVRRRRLVNDGLAGSPNRFITLTVNPHWFDGPADRGARLAKAWRDYVREYRRLHPGRELQYLAVLELTKKGEPHLHIVCRSGFIPQKELSKHMRLSMGAPVVDIRVVRGATEVARYVSKYISKRNIKLGTLKRYWSSQRYVPAEEKARRLALRASRAVWVIDQTLDEYRALLMRHGLLVAICGREGVSWPMFDWENRPPGYIELARRVK